MSFSVLVIPEDPLQNGHILKPLVKAIMRDIGRPNAKVRVLMRPRVRGYDDAVRTIRDTLHASYGFLDLWLSFPDADRTSRDAMRNLEAHVAAEGVTLLCCAAQPEVEIYACAGFRNEVQEEWENVRRHPRMKEDVFDPRQTGRGRNLMIVRSLKNLPLLFQLCPELQCLRDRIATLLQELQVRAYHAGA